MQFTPARDIVWEPASAENFVGATWFGSLDRSDDPNGLFAIGVLFEPGARTDWHHHPGGQTLYVASGAGYVQNAAGDSVRISAGDVVSIPADETHWHGAVRDSYLMHLSLTTGGAAVWDGRRVDTADYDAAAGR